MIDLQKKCLSHLGEVELQGVIRGKGNDESPGQVLRQGIAVIVEEQGVVGERGHGDADLGEIVEILEHGHLAQQETVGDVLGHEVAADQMLYGSGLAAMGAQDKGVHATFPKGVI